MCNNRCIIYIIVEIFLISTVICVFKFFCIIQEKEIEHIDEERLSAKRSAIEDLNKESSKHLKICDNIINFSNKRNTRIISNRQADDHNDNHDNVNDDDNDDIKSLSEHSLQRFKAFSSSKEYQECVKDLHKKSILSVLNTTSTGRYILKEYQTKGFLSEKSSKSLSSLIIDHFLVDSNRYISFLCNILFKLQYTYILMFLCILQYHHVTGISGI